MNKSCLKQTNERLSVNQSMFYFMFVHIEMILDLPKNIFKKSVCVR